MSLVFAVLLVSAQAAAQLVATPDATPPAEAPKKVKEKKICKLDDLTSGTRMTKRICLTEDEWAKRSRTSMYESSRAGTTGTAQDH